MTDMIQKLPVGRPLHVAGLGVPLIDFITPTEEEFQELDQIFAQLQHDVALPIVGYKNAEQRQRITGLAAFGSRKVEAAREALKEFNHFWMDERKDHLKDDNKFTLTEEESQKVAAWFQTMIEVIADAKEVTEFSGKAPPSLLIRHMGGTLTNKFHAIKGALGDRVSTHMLGALGNEDSSGNRKRVSNSLLGIEKDAKGNEIIPDEPKINFQEFPDVSLGNMAVSYIIPYKGDRIVLKAPFDQLPEKLHTHQDTIAHFAREVAPGVAPDMYFIEGTDYSAKKFGAESFDHFADAALASGKPIIFSPPTDTKMLEDDNPETAELTAPARAKARTAMDRIIDSPTTSLITLNESEVVAMFGHETYHKIKGIHPADHPQITAALDALTLRLKAKAEAQPEGSVEPLAFVSAGKGGSFYVTQNGYQFVEQRDAEKNISTIGAGDAFSSGVFVHYVNLCTALQEQGRTHFTPDELASVTNRGQELGREVVGYKGAQLPSHHVAATTYGPAPVSWVDRARSSTEQSLSPQL